jgi:hypothetical protein
LTRSSKLIDQRKEGGMITPTRTAPSTRSLPKELRVLENYFGAIPAIEKVIADFRPGHVSVTIVLPNPDSKVEKQVFQRELELIESLPDSIFDFEVIFSCGRDLSDIISPTGTVLFAR